MRVAVVKRLQQFLSGESSGVRMGYTLAIAGHVMVALLFIFGAFERIEPASAVVTVPVGIVMDTPAAQAPSSPASEPNEQNPAPSLPPVSDADKKAKAPLEAQDVNGADLPKQQGRDGGDPRSDPAGVPQQPTDGDLASGAASPSSQAQRVAPIGPAPPQTTASEPGEDELTALKEEKLECGRKAKRPSLSAAIRHEARVIGFATEAQGLAIIRSSQLILDRHVNPHYLTSPQVWAETPDGAVKFVVALPAGFRVNEGDVIEVDQGYVDPSDPCHYIPNVAVGKP